jgi:hypothetical protein
MSMQRTIAIVLKQNESRPECRLGSGLHSLMYPFDIVSVHRHMILYRIGDVISYMMCACHI